MIRSRSVLHNAHWSGISPQWAGMARGVRMARPSFTTLMGCRQAPDWHRVPHWMTEARCRGRGRPPRGAASPRRSRGGGPGAPRRRRGRPSGRLYGRRGGRLRGGGTRRGTAASSSKTRRHSLRSVFTSRALDTSSITSRSGAPDEHAGGGRSLDLAAGEPHPAGTDDGVEAVVHLLDVSLHGSRPGLRPASLP